MVPFNRNASILANHDGIVGDRGPGAGAPSSQPASPAASTNQQRCSVRHHYWHFLPGEGARKHRQNLQSREIASC